MNRGPWRPAMLSVAVVVACAVATRFVDLRHGLPGVLGADEPVVLDRTQQLLHGDLPRDYDWPTGAMVLLGGWLRVLGLVGVDASYGVARVLFAAVSLALVLATGGLAAAVAEPRRRWPVAAVAMASMVVAYPALRLGRVLHPDPLQALLVVTSLLAVVQLLRHPRWRWVLLAGFAAGLAAGTKYLGGLVAVPLAVAVLTAPGRGLGARLRLLAGGAAASMAGLVIAVPAVLVRPGEVLEGLRLQAFHQSGGHLGYEGEGPSFWWHVTTALPGTWGWGWTAVAVAGAAAVVAKGTVEQRTVALYVAAGYLAVAWGVVQFPHYVLVYLAPLAALAAVGLDAAVRRLPVRPPVAAAALAVVVVGLLAAPAADAVRLLRAEAAVDTRTLAAEVARSLDRPIVKEQYTDASDLGRSVARLGHHPDVVDCDCVVEISSYNEERYRARPERYAAELAVYDALRARGEVVAVVRPARRSSYRWDVLPQWGLRDLPLTGRIGPVGPTITFLDVGLSPPIRDLRAPRSG